MRETLIFDRKTMIGILDLRSLGYYKIKQGVLQQNLNTYYHFEEANRVCKAFNKMVETAKQEEKDKQKEKYLWLEDMDERKYMMDQEILDKYIDLRNSCFDDLERKQVMEMLYEYKDAFSLRDEIDKCPNIEENIEVTDNSPFFIRPYHVKEEDRAVLDKEMRRLCYLGILKEGFSAYSRPVMLISRKMTSDKRGSGLLHYALLLLCPSIHAQLSKHHPFIYLRRQRRTNTWSLKQRVCSARWKQAFPLLLSLVKM